MTIYGKLHSFVLQSLVNLTLDNNLPWTLISRTLSTGIFLRFAGSPFDKEDTCYFPSESCQHTHCKHTCAHMEKMHAFSSNSNTLHILRSPVSLPSDSVCHRCVDQIREAVGDDETHEQLVYVHSAVRSNSFACSAFPVHIHKRGQGKYYSHDDFPPCEHHPAIQRRWVLLVSYYQEFVAADESGRRHTMLASSAFPLRNYRIEKGA